LNGTEKIVTSRRTRMKNFKKIKWTDADVRCPFYISDDRAGCSICCEGYGEGVETVSRFESLRQRDVHMGRYCTSRFERCPVYGCTYDCKYRDI
jgi:hypothetical protein